MTGFARWRAWLRDRPLAGDAVLALALFGAQLVLAASVPRQPDQLPPLGVAGLTAVEMGFVVIRRRWPWVAVVGVVAFGGVTALTLAPGDTGGVGFIAIAYTTAAYLPLRQAIAATLVLWLPVLAYQVAARDEPAPVFATVPPWYLLVFNTLVATTCFFVGRAVRTRRAYTAALEERAAAAEANQRVLAAQAVAEERRRIARELHDLVAHHVAVMGVLATGARRTASRDPAAADEALATIEQTGRTVLREMRRLLEVLRSDSEPAGELAPAPGLAAVEALVDQVREAGLPVTLRVDGDPEPLDPGVALTLYRVVQEALTNVLKHAGPATAEVRIVGRGPSLQLEIFDTGHGPPPGGGSGVGHGLVSMRERVHLLGGTLRAGPRPGGGFRVYATIPTEHIGPAEHSGTTEHVRTSLGEPG
jgi:signal transduction histidine kinase